MFKKLIIFSLVAVLFSSCEEEYLFQESHPFAEAGWTYADSLQFDFEIADTSKRYNLTLTVHHSPDYPSENLYVQFATIFPKGQEALNGRNRTEQVTSLTLAQKDGRWLGKCTSKACVLKIPIQTNTWFPDPGSYSLHVAQYMRMDSLTGIKAIDFAIQENK